MTTQTNHDNLVKKVRGVFRKYGYIVEDKEGEMLKYLRKKYGYYYESRPDLICSSIKSLNTFTDFAIEAKTFESIKEKMGNDDKRQLQEINSVLPTFLLVYKKDYDKMKSNNYFIDAAKLGVGVIIFNEKNGQIEEIYEAKSKLNNIPLGNISIKHRIYQIFTSKRIFRPNHPHGVLFTKNNFIELLNWNREDITISHELDIREFYSGSWIMFKQKIIKKLHKFLEDKKVKHNANCFWSFHVGVAEDCKQIFGYDLPSFIFAVEKIILSHDTTSKKKTKINLLKDREIIEPWHNTHFEFFLWGDPNYYDRPHVLALKGKIDFITRRGIKSHLGHVKLESGRIISSLIHTNYIKAFSDYRGIDINYSIRRDEEDSPKNITISNVKFVPAISTFSKSRELESAYFLADYNGVEIGIETPYPEVIKKLFHTNNNPIKLSCKSNKFIIWDLEGQGIIQFIRVDN
jgi:hypothetical protein